MKPYVTAVFDNARWEGFEPRSDDIFVCTPPKCGTTWTQTIVANMIFPDGPPMPVMALSPWIEATMMMPADAMHEMLRGQTHRRVMKSHTPADGIPWFDDPKYIVVCRDGRDAFMSMVNHLARMKFTEQLNAQAEESGIDKLPDREADIHELFDYWLEDGVHYFDVVRTYWERKGRDNVLLVHFNDLKADLEGQMRWIAGFLGIALSEEQWPSVVERSTFEYMRNHDDLVGDMSIGFEGGTKGFLFKGTNGRWRDALSSEELERYFARLQAALPEDAVKWVTRE